MKSFLLIGQSNMAGRGELDEVPPIFNDKCFMQRNGIWTEMVEPINCDRGFYGKYHSGVGLSASFADGYAKEFDQEVALIPCAEGGTKIEEWLPGRPLFDNAVYHTKVAMKTTELAGILWHQGEANCKIRKELDCYLDNFLKMITELKKQTGIENVPIVVGEISEKISQNRWDIPLENIKYINEIIHSIPNYVANCSVVCVKGLELRQDDGIHFCSKAYRELGLRYFEAYKSLVK